MRINFKLFLLLLLVISCNYVFAAESNNDLSNKILYVGKVQGGKDCLFVMDPDGTNAKPLSQFMNNIVLPKYNKKTNIIGFTNHNEKIESEIYLLNVSKNSISKPIVGATLQDISTDGKYLLYTSTGENPALYMYDIEKKTKTKVSQNLNICSANWSRDGKWIIVSAFANDGSLDMYTISCYGQGILRITNTPKINEAFPMFSHDGNKVVYFTNRYGDQSEIEIFRADNNNDNIYMRRTGLQGSYPCFSPDGKFIVYQKGNEIMISDEMGANSRKIGNGSTPYWTK